MSGPIHDSTAQLSASLERQISAIPGFRWASEAELECSYAAYSSGNPEALCAEWARVAQPTRAQVDGFMGVAYARAGLAPRLLNATIFLDSVRAALRAGERMRAGLRPRVREMLETEFPYCQRRHEHVPSGSPASFEFPPLFAEFLSADDLDQVRARWQLVVCLNEVQQGCYTRFAARHLRLPELERHADREDALARNYLAHWSPRCTRALWRDTIHVLDALNAASFTFAREVLFPRAVGPRGWLDRRARAQRWELFVAGLDTPQWLLPRSC